MSERLPDACDERKDDLVALALGEPLGSREADVRAHAGTCAGCKAYLAAMSGTLDAVRALPAPEPSAALIERILAAADADAGAADLPAEERAGALEGWLAAFRALFRRPLLAYAVASVAVAVVAVVILVLSGRGPRQDDAAGGRPPVVARLVEPNAAPGPASPFPAAPARQAPPPAATEPSEHARQTGEGLVALEEDRNGLAENERARGGEDAPEEAPILATIVAAPAAGARAQEGEDDRGASGSPVHVALAQPATPDDGRPRETGTGAAAPTVPAPSPSASTAGQDQARIDGDTSERFYVGREITAGSDDAAATRGSDRSAAVNVPPTTPPVGATGVADARTEGEAQEPRDASVAGDAYRQPSRTGTGEQTVPGASPSPPPPPPPSGAPAQPAVVAYGGVAEQPAPEDYEWDGSDYAMDEYAGVSVASSISAPTSAGWGGASAAPPAAPPPADDVETARRRLGEGRAAEAEEILEDALRGQVVRAADTTYLLAETYARQGKWSDAARTYELFLARYLDDSRADEARWRAAEAYRRSGATTRAAALLEQLVGVPGYDSRARTVIDEMAVDAVNRAAAESVGGGSTSMDIPAAAPPAEPVEAAGSAP